MYALIIFEMVYLEYLLFFYKFLFKISYFLGDTTQIIGDLVFFSGTNKIST